MTSLLEIKCSDCKKVIGYSEGDLYRDNVLFLLCRQCVLIKITPLRKKQ